MTSPEPRHDLDMGLPQQRLFFVLGPVVGVVSFSALLALASALMGFHRDEMMVIAAAAGAAVALPALLLLYRQ
ncbi:MAG TPA: hypothetical protein VF309_00750, partial [Usitatibacter sp.]